MFRMANQDIRRHFSLTFSSILSIAVALFIAMIMGIFALNLDYVTQGLEEEFIIQVSISPSVEQEEIPSLMEKIEKLKDVESVSYSSKEDELDALIEENGDVFSQYKESNPLYDVLVVNLKDKSNLDSISKKIENMDGVAKVNYGGTMITTLVSLMAVVRKWGYVFLGIMIILAIYLIRNTIKLTIQTRKDEIMIMRNVGAMNWYVTFPFMLEGMIFGFFGSLIPILICDIGYYVLYSKLDGVLVSSMLKIMPFMPNMLYLSLGILLVGLIVGVIGSYLASHKYLKWTR
ncbi:permease-like cell division protein FtsX [Floccifex sp.]|uniref:permease-like cell division protein FtsX n=1 Tax=Floccifex sp. TaxID=2815810 RepID=UPI002A764CB5|nr:permease-like cell division protein FtsX [Floccifex sp.]MDD7282067.1 permease-like cell division protein FtsX [Erysipelotrichaceae bacterium]MDY2958764.1 permease-like cell division protein FtsX [Floccifex sp.]